MAKVAFARLPSFSSAEPALCWIDGKSLPVHDEGAAAGADLGGIIASVADIWEHGCELHVSADVLQVGRFVSLQFADLAQVIGLVRSASNNLFGVEFVHSLPSELVQAQDRSRSAVRILCS